MADDQVRFIRRGGKVIPIRLGQGEGKRLAKGALKIAGKAGKKLAARGVLRGAALAGSAYSVKKNIKKLRENPKQKDIKVNQGLNALGIGLSVASGAIGAATFSGGMKGMLGGLLAGHALDVGGVAANVGSVAGKGKLTERAKQAARQEARNFLIGNAVYAAGLVGIKRNREKLVEYAGKIVNLARKALVRT